MTSQTRSRSSPSWVKLWALCWLSWEIRGTRGDSTASVLGRRSDMGETSGRNWCQEMRRRAASGGMDQRDSNPRHVSSVTYWVVEPQHVRRHNWQLVYAP